MANNLYRIYNNRLYIKLKFVYKCGLIAINYYLDRNQNCNIKFIKVGFHVEAFNLSNQMIDGNLTKNVLLFVDQTKNELTWLLCVQQIDGGGSGECWTIQVKLTVEPVFMYMSGPPTIVLIGSVIINK